MSMNQPTQVCTPEDSLIVQDTDSGEIVYAYCTVHGLESVNPLFAIFFPEVIEQFRRGRDDLLKKAEEEGKPPHFGMSMQEVTQTVSNPPDSVLLN